MPAHHFIANTRRPASDDRTIPVIDPADGQAFDRIARGSAQDIDQAVRAAQAAMGEHFDGPWALTCARDRGRLLAAWGRAVLEHADELAGIEARDTGKTLRTARNDVLALARYFEYYAGACDKLHGETLPYDVGTLVMTVREPHGVTGHIIPWNYPVQIFGRSVGASLAAGNACVVKPAEDASLSTLYLAEMAARVGFPPGALNVVTGYGAEAGAALSAHPGIRHISFTGSTVTGQRVAEAAARHHCPVVLELGGKSPQIVFDDADLDAALPVIVNAIIQNSGQTCSAGSRLLVHESIHDAFVERVAERFRALRAGPPASDADLGPLVNRTQYERVRAMLDTARREGLTEAARGRILDGAPPDGYYQEAVLLRAVPRDSVLAREEIFGPVLITQAFRDEAHALELANSTDYGLVAGVWTRDGARQLRMARHLRCGQVFINNYGAGGGVELPFGGVKSSGHGREKGFEALLGFTALKTVAIRYGRNA
ncbi:aldehyde dehydrogenase family protein [Castellaniella denitrificans]|uniref:Aldehyde dehydrogenase family protein n=1 Tax=Castellaniella denitrificans TaxID=56119 RepID=A0ABT4M0D6_9BURK|nr:aldehyde dehydrogenase family protein [Castellaniella denitrificans]MCZ4328756.1 aldehyde dehydrogenase family protein [Castellaniella denitrificans]